jgi:hypothetical protein
LKPEETDVRARYQLDEAVVALRDEVGLVQIPLRREVPAVVWGMIEKGRI